jgi:hypothetical protein
MMLTLLRGTPELAIFLGWPGLGPLLVLELAVEQHLVFYKLLIQLNSNLSPEEYLREIAAQHLVEFFSTVDVA